MDALESVEQFEENLEEQGKLLQRLVQSNVARQRTSKRLAVAIAGMADETREQLANHDQRIAELEAR